MNKVVVFFCFLMVSCSTLKFSNSTLDNFKREDFVNNSQPFSTKYNAEIEIDGKRHKVEGTIKVNSNNDVYINSYSTAYGIEVFKLVLSGDSILFIDKVNKKYFKDVVNSFNYNKLIKIDKIDLLNLLFGKVCFFNSKSRCDSIKTNFYEKMIFYNCLDSVNLMSGKIEKSENNILINQVIGDRNGSIDAEYIAFNNKLNLPDVIKFRCVLMGFTILIDLNYTDFKFIDNEYFILKTPNKYSEWK